LTSAETGLSAGDAPDGRQGRLKTVGGRLLLKGLFASPLRPMPAHWRRWLVVLLAVSAIPRVVFRIVGGLLWYPDSQSYQAMTKMFLQGDLSQYDAVRTPGYPAFMCLFGDNLAVVWTAQLLLGLVTTALLFWMALKLTHSLAVALASGAIYGLSIMQLHYESSLLSESLSALLVVASMSLAVSLTLESGRHDRVKQLGLGLLSAAAAATRPALALVPLVALLSVLTLRGSRIKAALLVLLPSIVVMVGWSAFNYATVGSFTPTSITGVALYTHARPMVGDAPPEYADITAVVRDLTASTGGSPSEWQVADELVRRSGRSISDVSHEMLTLSVRLFLDHPGLYARRVALASAWFFKGTGRGDFHWSDPSGVISPVWTATKLVFSIGLGMVFCLGLLVVPFHLRTAVRSPRGRAWLCLAAVIVLSCVFQALSQFGANSRYGMPFQPLWGVCGLVFLYEAVRAWRPRVQTQPLEEGTA
jgi:hypothetical protein